MPAQKGKRTNPSKSRIVREVRAKYKVRSERTNPSRQNIIIKKCKETLVKYYGDRLQGVILYGSVARKQAISSSDVDLLVLLTPPLDYFVELRQLVDVLYIQLESEQLISAKPVSVNDFEAGSISLYRNAKRKGLRCNDSPQSTARAKALPQFLKVLRTYSQPEGLPGTKTGF